MRTIITKFGKVYYDDNTYFIERTYEELTDLIYDEKAVKRNIKDNKFDVINSEWQLKKYPSGNDLKFTLKLELKYKK